MPPRGSKRDPGAAGAPAILVLRIDGAFALEAQHAAATIVAPSNHAVAKSHRKNWSFMFPPLLKSTALERAKTIDQACAPHFFTCRSSICRRTTPP